MTDGAVAINKEKHQHVLLLFYQHAENPGIFNLIDFPLILYYY
jgi:hypothetical protein